MILAESRDEMVKIIAAEIEAAVMDPTFSPDVARIAANKILYNFHAREWCVVPEDWLNG